MTPQYKSRNNGICRFIESKYRGACMPLRAGKPLISWGINGFCGL